MKVSIIIPVYNEAPTVATLIERVLAQPLPGCSREVIVVESNSADGSREIVAGLVARYAHEVPPRIRAIYEERPRGKGHAVRQGLAAAGGDILLIQDADLEYDVADYPDLLRPIVEGRTAFVLGSRHMRQSWKIRQFAHHGLLALMMNAGGVLFHGLFNALFAVRLSDPTSMFKVFRSECLRGLTFSCNRFDFDYELLGKLLLAGYYPLEVPVTYRSRGFDQGKKIRVLRDPATWIYAIIRCRLSGRLAHGSPARRCTLE